MQGAQLVEIMRERRPGLQVLLMSGYAELNQPEHADVRIDLKKPIRQKALGEALRDALARVAAD